MRCMPTPFGDGMRNLKLKDASVKGSLRVVLQWVEKRLRACGWVSHVAHRNKHAKRAENWTFHNRPFGTSYGKDWNRSLITCNCYKSLRPLTKWVAPWILYTNATIYEWGFFFWETRLQWWRNIICEWHSEQAQCANLGQRKCPRYRASHSWLPKR